MTTDEQAELRQLRAIVAFIDEIRPRSNDSSPVPGLKYSDCVRNQLIDLDHPAFIGEKHYLGEHSVS